MENNNAFLLYTSYAEILSDLSNEQLGELFRAILEYKTTKKQPVVSVELSVVFKFIKNQLDIDEKKYNEISQKRSDNGKKGGAPKGNQNARKQPKTTKNNQNKHNDNDNDNDNVNDIKEKINKKENNPVNPDLIFDPVLRECFSLYETNCKRLIPLICEKRDRPTLKLLDEVLNNIDRDTGQFEQICLKANELVTIAEKKIDFRMMLRNYIGILNGKYKAPSILEGIVR